MHQRLALLTLLWFPCWLGCDGNQPNPSSQQETGDDQGNQKNPPPDKFASPDQRRPARSKSNGFRPATGQIYLPETGKIISLIEDSVQFGPTLVIWMLDPSRSSIAHTENVTGQLQDYYKNPRTSAGGANEGNRLLSAVVTCGESAEYLLESPSARGSEVAAAMDSIRVDPSGHENAFLALQSAVDKYLDYRLQKNREMIVVVVTDEAGDDSHLLDPLTKSLVKYAIPVYVIGTPAPLGYTTVVNSKTEAPLNFKGNGSWQPIVQGPESRYSERIVLDRWGSHFGWDRINSGFGPFAWEYLCRSTGGSYLKVSMAGYTPEMLRGPYGRAGSSLIGSYDTLLMQPYAPDYVSEDRYQALLDSNAACRALHEAGQLGRRKILMYPVMEFPYKSEAQLSTDVTQAQLEAARLEPEINTLYEILKKGESDRDTLSSPRWQAGYDLAMGRALAAKVRIEGYNAILAVLKRGRSFEQETSSRWILIPANSIDAGSTLQRLSSRAQMYLHRVLDDHPKTPWATLAEQELQTPVGWKWTER